MSVEEKYAGLADAFAAREYGDAGWYLGHRAEIVRTLGPPLVAGDHVVDLACADAAFAAPLLRAGLRYTGVDATAAMVEVGRARAHVERGDMLTWRPPERVAATVCFRSLHFVADRATFFSHVASYTDKKVVFDWNPRRDTLERLRRDLAAAGLTRVDLRPFLVPQHVALPRPLRRALAAVEPTPLGRLVLRVRFSYLCAASRGS